MQGCIQGRVLHDCGHIDVSIENQAENRHTCVDSRIAQDQCAIVNGNRNEVENTAEYGLDHRDYQASVDHELA